jgi:hypothetical protein
VAFRNRNRLRGLNRTARTRTDEGPTSRQLRYVVVELKVGRFKPEYTGQLGFYVAVVDDQIRDPDRHAPTVGILLCASRNDAVVRYALASSTAPMAVANYASADPVEFNLPQPDELAAILTAPLPGDPARGTLGDALPADEE